MKPSKIFLILFFGVFYCSTTLAQPPDSCIKAQEFLQSSFIKTIGQCRSYFSREEDARAEFELFYEDTYLVVIEDICEHKILSQHLLVKSRKEILGYANPVVYHQYTDWGQIDTQADLARVEKQCIELKKIYEEQAGQKSLSREEEDKKDKEDEASGRSTTAKAGMFVGGTMVVGAIASTVAASEPSLEGFILKAGLGAAGLVVGAASYVFASPIELSDSEISLSDKRKDLDQKRWKAFEELLEHPQNPYLQESYIGLSLAYYNGWLFCFEEHEVSSQIQSLSTYVQEWKFKFETIKQRLQLLSESEKEIFLKELGHTP